MAGVVGDELPKQLYTAAATGDVNTIQHLLQQDPFLLHLVSFPCSRNLLHVATMHEQPAIVEEILRRNPQIARDSDSQKWSPLHIAAAGGHVEIASKLLSCAPEMVWSRDGQGMNPIHVAAMNGHKEMLEMLIEFDPAPAKERVDRGQTALHLCAKHGQLEALKVLVEKVGELIHVQDDDGETLLHFAIRYKRLEILAYLVRSDKVKNSTNSKGETAGKVMSESFPDDTSSEVREIKDALLTSQQKMDVSFIGLDELMTRATNEIMVVVVLLATMAYQSGVSPPGGVWQEDSSSRRAGEAVMASRHPKLYKQFVGANTTAFVSSLVSILLLSVNFSLKKKMKWVWPIIGFAVWMSLASIAISYGASLTVITPHMEPQSLDRVITIVVIVTVGFFVYRLIRTCIMDFKTFISVYVLN